jgi:hypothetical protein
MTSTTNVLLSHIKEALHASAEMAIALFRASEIAPEYKPVFVATREIVKLLDIAVEQQVERTTADQAVEDAIAEVDAEAEAYAEAEASMMEAAGAAVMEAINDKRLNMMYNPGALAEALASDSDELASKEADRLKAADEAVVEAMRERLMENAAWAAANPDLAAPGFVLNVLWIGLGNPTREEVSELIRGNIGAISADIELIHPGHFDDAEDGFVTAVCEHACRFDHDVIAGDFSADQALQLGIAVAQDEEPYGVRFAVRKDGGGFRIFMV